MKPQCPAAESGALLARMTRALEADDGFAVAQHHEDGAALGRVGLSFLGSGDCVVWNGDRTRCLVMEGELYDVQALQQSFETRNGRARDTSSQAELLLHLFEHFGTTALARLNGAFAAAVWDRRARELTVFNDRLGLFPVYYARVGDGVLFGSGVRALLADPALDRTIDALAVSQFMVYDHMLDDRTLLEAVRLLPQASVLTARDGRVTIQRYWTLRYPELYEPRQEADYVEQFMHHLRQAVARQHTPGRPAAMLLSGGLDSRLIAGALGEIDSGVSTLTFGIPGCDDARVAAEVASVVGARHRFVELKPDWLLHHAEEAVRVTDGLGNMVNLHAMTPAASAGADVLFKGFMGDALLGWALKRYMWGDYSTEHRHQVHLGAHGDHGVLSYDRAGQRAFFSDALQRQVGERACRAYNDGLDRASVSQLANQRLYFDLTQRVPRMTLNGVEVARRRAAVRLPFCDNDLVDFTLTVPPGFLFERHLPKAALIRYFPALAQVPMAGTNRTLTSCLRDVTEQVRTLASWHLDKARLGWLVQRPRRPYKDYDRWFRTLLRPWVEETLLRPQALERGYFRPEYVRQLVSEHMAGANHAIRLGALMTLELWHRQHVD